MMSTFELSRKSVFGEMISHPLKPGGADMLVNNDNRKVRKTRSFKSNSEY